jgi:hypothetical protein
MRIDLDTLGRPFLAGSHVLNSLGTDFATSLERDETSFDEDDPESDPEPVATVKAEKSAKTRSRGKERTYTPSHTDKPFCPSP